MGQAEPRDLLLSFASSRPNFRKAGITAATCLLIVGGSDRPIHLRLEAFEASPADPEIVTGCNLCVVRVPIATAFLMRLFPLRKTFTVVTHAGEAGPAVVVGPAFVRPVPLLPNEHRVAIRRKSSSPFVNVLNLP